MKLYVGVDVSKKTLDIHLNGRNFFTENSPEGLTLLIKRLEEQPEQGHEIGLVLCEASGGYEKLLIDTLRLEGFPVHKALAIFPNQYRANTDSTVEHLV